MIVVKKNDRLCVTTFFRYVKPYFCNVLVVQLNDLGPNILYYPDC